MNIKPLHWLETAIICTTVREGVHTSESCKYAQTPLCIAPKMFLTRSLNFTLNRICDPGCWTSWRYREPSTVLLLPEIWLPSQSFSITPSVKLHRKCFFGCRFKNIICKKGWRLNNYKTNKGNGSRSFCTFLYSEERERSCYFWRPSTSDHITCTIQYNSKYITIGSEASLQQKHNTQKDYQQRQRDSWWFSNRVYSSFLSLVKRWQIHLISAVWCYMNFTGETSPLLPRWAWNLNPHIPFFA